MVNQWLPPGNSPSGHRWLAIRVPQNEEWRMPVWGALLLLTRSYYWESGGLDVDEIAAEYQEMYDSRRWGDILQPGELVQFAGSTIPENRLVCDGAAYNCDDYPALFSAIGYTWGGSGDTFKVPDLRGRAAIGDGSGTGLTARTLAEKNGYETHTLTTPQMPTHSHVQHFDYVIGLLGEVPVPKNILVWGYTGLTANIAEYTKGGDQPHNNMQPYTVVKWLIVT